LENEKVLEKLIVNINYKIENIEKEIRIAANNPGLQLNPLCDEVEKQTLNWVLEEIERLKK